MAAAMQFQRVSRGGRVVLVPVIVSPNRLGAMSANGDGGGGPSGVLEYYQPPQNPIDYAPGEYPAAGVYYARSRRRGRMGIEPWQQGGDVYIPQTGGKDKLPVDTTQLVKPLPGPLPAPTSIWGTGTIQKIDTWVTNNTGTVILIGGGLLFAYFAFIRKG